MKRIFAAVVVALLGSGGVHAQEFYPLVSTAGDGWTHYLNVEHIHVVEYCSSTATVAPLYYACFIMDGEQAGYEHTRLRSRAEWDVEWPKFQAFIAGEVPPLPRPTGVNTVPTVAIEGPRSVTRGESIELTAVVTDPDMDDSWSYQWGISSARSGPSPWVGANAETATFHATTTADALILNVTVVDYRGGRASETHTVTIN